MLACQSEKPTNQNVNNTHPIILQTFPRGDTTFATGDSILIDLSAYDADGDVIIKTAEIGDDIFDLPLRFSCDTAAIFRVKYVASDGIEAVEKYRNITAAKGPYCSITYPAEGGTIALGDIRICVDAFDEDGTVAAVEFYINGNLAGSDSTEPYEYMNLSFWNEIGDCSFKAVAVDDDGLVTSSEVRTAVALFLPVNPFADTIYVPEQYESIQSALYASYFGDVIRVGDGEYRGNINIDHSVSIIGNGENTIILNSYFHIHSDKVVIRKIKIEEPPYQWPAIYIGGSSYVLLDSIYAVGSRGGMECDPYYWWWCWPTDGSSGIMLDHSGKVIIQNSTIVGGPESDEMPGGLRGSGFNTTEAQDIFIINSSIEGFMAINANWHSRIGVRNCEFLVDASREYWCDLTSKIIFP